MASTTRETDHPVAQHRLDEHRDHAGEAERRVADRLGFGDRTMRAATPAGAVVPHIGQRDRQQRAVDDAADQIADETPSPSSSAIGRALASRSSHGNGTSAKLPVTSSSPSSTMMTRPTGKISAPTSGCRSAPRR